MKIKIGIFGSAVESEEVIKQKAREIGKLIAKNGWIAVTGATTGLPYEAVKGAFQENGETIGFSPATDEEKHIAIGYPVKELSEIYYIPQNYEHKEDINICRKYRNVLSTAFVDVGIIISGRCGTLNEFTNLYDMGKLIGVLTNTKGIADHIKDLIKVINKETDATVVFDDEPERLIEKIKENLS